MSASFEHGTGAGGLRTVTLRSDDGAVAEVYLHGAHVTAWCPASDGEPRLFLSGASGFADGVAIRGGIPVIFPQFALQGPLPRHGFARTRPWTLSSLDEVDGGAAVATFVQDDDAETRAAWPHEFVLTLAVRVGGPELRVALSVENAGKSTFSFAAALHTYLRVRDIAAAELVGLHGTGYRVSGHTGMTFDAEEALRFTAEIDRVYSKAADRLLLRDTDRAMRIEKRNFPDVVVWNPGAAASAAMADMEPDGYRRMLCVEAAAVTTPVILDPIRRWVGTQSLIATPLVT